MQKYTGFTVFPYVTKLLCSAVDFSFLTRVMTPSSWAVVRDAIFGVERPLTGGEELARERAVTEVGIVDRGRSVTFSPSMLPLFTRLSISSARSSADSRSTWIILQQMTMRKLVSPTQNRFKLTPSHFAKCTYINRQPFE